MTRLVTLTSPSGEVAVNPEAVAYVRPRAASGQFSALVTFIGSAESLAVAGSVADVVSTLTGVPLYRPFSERIAGHAAERNAAMTAGSVLRAMETDNGPGGMSWEVDSGAPDFVWLGSYASLAEVRAAYPIPPIEVYTYAAWEAAQMGGDPDMVGPTYTLAPGERAR